MATSARPRSLQARRLGFPRVNRSAFIALLLPLAITANPPHVMSDGPHRWEAKWSLGAWHCDSTHSSRRIVASAYGDNQTPGALMVPVVEATIAVPPTGTWSVDVFRDSSVLVPGVHWVRAPGWAQNPIRPVKAPEITPPLWMEENTPQCRVLHLSIPWAESGSEGLRLARALRVVVTMNGQGGSPLPASIHAVVANPAGSALFGKSISSGSGAGRSLARHASTIPDGNQTLVLTVRNPTVGDLSHDGVASVTGTQIQSILGSLNGVDFSSIAVGDAPRGPIPIITGSSIPDGSLNLLPIRRIDINGNGRFDPEDRIEFFVHGPSFWEPDTTLGDGLFAMNVHPWDLSRRYIIRLDAPVRSPDLLPGKTPAAPTASQSILRPVWAGKHTQLRVPEIGSGGAPDLESGASWFWYWADSTSLDSSKLSHPASTNLPGLAGTTGIGVVRFALLVPDRLDALRANGGASSLRASQGSRTAWNLQGLKPSNNRWTWQSRGHDNDFESYSVHYPYAPTRSNFASFPAPGLGAFSIPVPGAGPTDSVIAVEAGVGVRILPLTNNLLQDSVTTLDTWYTLATPTATTELVAWKAASGSRSLSPSAMQSNLRAEMLVVAPDSFLDLATQYAEYRSNSRRLRPLDTKIVRTEDLWSLWGHGSQDPLAIRDMLRLAVSKWGTTHVLLLGGGHYDPRGVKGAIPGPIPIWEDQDVATDAVLTFLDPGAMAVTGYKTQNVALGRIPARSRSEVSAWMAKLHAWEDPDIAQPGPWRNTFLAAADDMQIRSGGGSPDPIYQPDGYMGHTEAIERILRSIQAARPWAQFRKVYEVEYPMNAVLEKPDAQRALIDQLNRGAAVMQYMGHGGWNVLTDERLLDTRSALAGLTNSSTPFIFYAGSCTVGKHDLAFDRGLSEALVVAAGKGAVATISGTRPSFPDDNEHLAKNFWGFALTNPDPAHPRTLGEAFLAAQNSFPSGASDKQARYSNSSIYNLLGDPAMVAFPGGSPLSLENAPDSLAALNAYDLKGSGESDVQVSLITHPFQQVATYNYQSDTYQQTYQSPGRTLVSMKTHVSSGKYLAHILTPARIPFGDTASILLYGWNPATLRDSAVQDTQVILSGVGNNISADHDGPKIRVLPCDSSWTSGQPFGRTAEIPLPFCLNIFLDDTSGISSSDAPDEGVIFSVPGTLPAWHPTLQEGGNFSQAWARVSLDAETFKPGQTYPLNIYARDLMGNAASASIDLHTRASGDVDLYEVFNRPNPAKGASTTFYFKLLSDADSNGTVPGTVQASIRIHTISGKLIRILNTDLTDVGHPRPRAVWNLQDAFRNDVANGLYPYNIILRVKDATDGNWRQIEKQGIVAVSR